MEKATVYKIFPNNRVVVTTESDAKVITFNTYMIPFTEGDIGYVTENRTLIKKIVYKTDLWKRANDEEVSLLLNALNEQTERKQRIFSDAQYLDHDDPFFEELKNVLTSLLGNERTDELLEISLK